MPRKTEYTEKMGDKICEAVSMGANLNKLAATDGFPAQSTMYKWLSFEPSFAEKYARAREIRADYRSDRMDDIVEKTIQGKIPADVARVALDTEKWQAGKERPAYYGNNQTTTHKGELTLKRLMQSVMEKSDDLPD